MTHTKEPTVLTFGVGIPLISQGRLGALLAVSSAMGGGGKSRKCEQEESVTYGRGECCSRAGGSGKGAEGCTQANKDSADKANVTQSHACAKMSQQS